VSSAIRRSKRQLIEGFFAESPGKRYSSANLHARFGSSFRTRVSEINRDSDSPIQIFNETCSTETGEASVYWAELRSKPRVFPEFGDLSPDRSYLE
jgi:hypothetical protein